MVDKKSGKHRSQWYCDCDCGTKHKLISGTSLTSGAIRSCGCLHREIASETGKKYNDHKKKYNRYNLSGNYGIGFTTKNEEFYFDLEDYNEIKDICWHLSDDKYVRGYDMLEHKEIMQHRLINKPSDWQVVDHINGCKNDNRKKNLRNVRQTDNAKNISTPINNTSGHIGVSYIKKYNKWTAYITHNNKRIFLGNYDNFIDAVDAREKAEDIYFKEFRRKNEISNKK